MKWKESTIETCALCGEVFTVDGFTPCMFNSLSYLNTKSPIKLEISMLG